MRELCLPSGLSKADLEKIDQIVSQRIRRKRGETLFRSGDRFTALYALRVGSCKTSLLAEDGREQVTGYHLIGDIIGLDGIGQGKHGCHAYALEDSEFCELPFTQIEHIAHLLPSLQHNLHQVMSREIARDHQLITLLGSMRAEERLASFLLNLSQRYQLRGYSSTEFVLRMTREEIGSFLGLKLETVSRLFSRFQEAGLLRVQQRSIKLLDTAALKQLVSETC